MDITNLLTACLWPVCTFLTLIGCLYALFAVFCVHCLDLDEASHTAERGGAAPSVSILKPLHGPEPELQHNLTSFLAQSYDGPIELICGVARPEDEAAAIAEQVAGAPPARSIRVVRDARMHGSNRKISNLINTADRSSGDLVVISDSDIRVERDYLQRVVSALLQPGVGAVTCLYRGLPLAGRWSYLSAMAIDHHFLPNVLVGLRLGIAKPCFGSTIAMRRETLQQIGGLGAFADHLADDHAMGMAVRRLGLTVAVPPLVVEHGCAEASFSALMRHELRWARTIKLLDPAGFAGTLITHPTAIAALCLAATPGPASALSFGLALACRAVLQIEVDRKLGVPGRRWLLGPVRDMLSFAVFLVSFLPGAVDWRGERLKVHRDGTMTPSR